MSLSTMPDNDVLREALVDGTVMHPDGHKIKVVANINPDCCRALYSTVLTRKPQLVVEIGMAYGVSTLAILSALEANGQGRLISIDPYIGWPTGRLVALNQVERAGLAGRHEHRHECSYAALAQLKQEGPPADFVYIDGNHNFDYAFTDFFLSDKLIATGGLIGFNDAGWRSVFRVIRFLEKYRHYREIDVGLPRSFRARNPIFSLIRRIEGRSSDDRYFEKLDDWEPDGACLQIPGP
ncbi:MAG TPA: class I SAM-dependent methyltransferase [Pirellulaceae bacterium]|nr:class I SAM-dependent methyltransferase [Pirellulaceae bacterium]